MQYRRPQGGRSDYQVSIILTFAFALLQLISLPAVFASPETKSAPFFCIDETSNIIIPIENVEGDSKDLSFYTLAQKEARRYLYHLTGILPKFTTEKELDAGISSPLAVIIANKNSAMLSRFDLTGANAELAHELTSLQPEGHLVKTIWLESVKMHAILCIGHDAVGTLYSVYSLMELLGIRFYISGDVLPSEAISSIPHLSRSFAPVFEIRGIQPFHDFPEGPDWWSEDDYKSHISQISKMKMNFIGLHTYPPGSPLGEPTVWQGPPSRLNANGTAVQSYPVGYFSTLQDTWGYSATNSSDLLWGNSMLFNDDCATGNSNLMDGICPLPNTTAQQNLMFSRVASFLKTVFEHAHQVGVKTCVGTETPVTMMNYTNTGPDSTLDYYRGTFEWVMSNFDIDYYWIWTPEGWEWGGVTTNSPGFIETVFDLLGAYQAWQDVKANFKLATSGWVLGPADSRAYWDGILPEEFTLSTLDANVGNTPVDPAFLQVIHHNKWAIPWLEDDPGLLGIQLWVNRTMNHTITAYKYGCNGILGIHWRTYEVSPQLSALAQTAWNLNLTSNDYWLDFAAAQFGSSIAAKAANILTTYESFNLPRPVTWVNGPGGMQSNNNDWSKVALLYSFVDDFAALRSNVTGLQNIQRFDYWRDTFMFLKAIAKTECSWGYVETFLTSDVYIEKDPKIRQVIVKYFGINKMASLVADLRTMMTYLQQTIYSTGEMGTVVNAETHSINALLASTYDPLNALLGYIGCYQDGTNHDLSGAKISSSSMTPAYCMSWCAAQNFAYSGVQNGTYCYCGNRYGSYGQLPFTSCNMACSGDSNFQCGDYQVNSVYLTAGQLPANATPSAVYNGPSRLIVPTVRTSLDSNEDLRLKAILLTQAQLKSNSSAVTLYYRPLGGSQYTPATFTRVANRGVYTLTVPAGTLGGLDFEYYVQATIPGTTLRFPLTGTQTVIIL